MVIKKFLTTTALAVVLAGSVSTPAEANILSKAMDAASAVVHGVENAGKAVVKGAVNAGKAIVHTAEDIAKAIAGPVKGVFDKAVSAAGQGASFLLQHRSVLESAAVKAISAAQVALDVEGLVDIMLDAVPGDVPAYAATAVTGVAKAALAAAKIGLEADINHQAAAAGG